MFTKYQPFKALYLLYDFFTIAFIRAPFWLAVSIPRSWRPRPSWGIKRTLLIRGLRHICSDGPKSQPGTPNHLALGPPGPNIHALWVDGTPHLITGPLETWAEIASVTPIRIPGYWLHKSGTTIPAGASPMPGEKVVYCLHGGGYTAQSAHPTDLTGNIAYGILAHSDHVHRVFSIEYRLSVTHPFPAALLDALAGYHYLVATVGIPPDAIIIEGDSAGGNLALALIRYLIEHRGAALPAPPGALLLFSPWTDLGSSHIDIPGSSATAYVNSDFIVGETRAGTPPSALVVAFLEPHGLGAADFNAYVSPGSRRAGMCARFDGFPRTFIVAGGAETLYDQIRTLRDRMERYMGASRVRWYEAQDGTHDYVMFTWHEPERSDTLRAIAKWIAEE